MPLYEYRCDACEHQFEVIQSYSDKPLKKCEKCGGKVQKLVSRSGFVLKGGGWYKTDYAGKGGGSKSAKPSSSAPSGGDSDSGGSKPDSGGDSGKASSGAA